MHPRIRTFILTSMSTPRLVSVVLAVKNAAATVESALESALAQTYKPVEIIVIDGASTDGTRAIVERRAEDLAYWHSAPDAGIGDAWNQGIAQAKGDVIILLNADDALRPDFVEKAVEALPAGTPAIAFGDTLLLDDRGRTFAQVRGNFDPSHLDRGFGFWHTSCAVTRAAYDLVGEFDPKVRVAVDTEWLLRAHRAGVPFLRHESLNYMRLGGISDRRHREARREYAAQVAALAPGSSRWTSRVRATLTSSAIDLLGLARWVRWRRQMALVALAGFHLVYNGIPSWTFRRWLLRLWNIQVGERSAIHSPVRFLSRGRVTVGSGTVINRDCVIDNRMHVRIGNDVSIGQGTRIFTLGHDLDDPHFASIGGAVELDDRAVTFAGAMLMPGARLHEGSVALAGAVVTGEVDAWTVVAGVPARFVRTRSKEQRYALPEPYHFQV